MKRRHSILLLCVFINSLYLFESCGCDSRHLLKNEEVESDVSIRDYKLLPPTEKQIDSIVHLSFLGITLGEDIHSSVINPKVTYQSTVTEESVRIYTVPRKIAFGNGYSATIPLEVFTVNDTICKIHGTIIDNITNVLFDTYAAKYGEPTSGRIPDKDDDTFNSAGWKYINQGIQLYKSTDHRINLEARPIYEYDAFRDINIYYEDFELYKHYCSINTIQIEYDNKMKPIRDSVEAARKQAIEDSLNALKRKKLLETAPQI